MTDDKIIELLFERDERGLSELSSRYGYLCKCIAANFLSAREDVEECINDVLLELWNKIPPERPEELRSYVAALTRNRAIDKARANKASKRGGKMQIVGEEFLTMLDDGSDLANEFEARRTGEVISAFLGKIGEEAKDIFVMRYFLGMGCAEIADASGYTEGKVKMSLWRTRKKLAQELRKEGIIV